VSRAFIIRLATALLVLAALPSCSRRTLGDKLDAGSDAGGPSVGDGARVDLGPGDVAADVAPDIASDVARDVALDSASDVSRDTGVDALPAVCPASAPPLDVCGCGCCGGVAGTEACYYTSLGQMRDTIPNPMPTPQECATNGCSEGVRYLCCADPGVQQTPTAIFCATNTSGEDLPLFSFTKRDAEACTTIQIGLASGSLPLVSTPFGPGVASAWRGPCGGSARTYPIGGLGSVTARPRRPGDASTHYDVHVALFFHGGTGIADVSRIDVDDIAVAPACAGGTCSLCTGACAFDATYRYGFTGGHVAFVDEVTLAPPASYEHRRSPVTTMPADITCAPPPPACGGPAIDVGDIMAALADADVQEAFTRVVGSGFATFYGDDPRPSDGQAFQVTNDGRPGFLIGGPCPTGSTSSSCLEIPGGLARLKSLLMAFDQQQLQSDPTCAPLRP
jgi:hypothetical protein